MRIKGRDSVLQLVRNERFQLISGDGKVGILLFLSSVRPDKKFLTGKEEDPDLWQAFCRKDQKGWNP